MIERFEQGIANLEESGVLRENIICHITQESLGRWDFALMDKNDSNIFIRSGEWFTL